MSRRAWMWILWPSFLMAGFTSAIVFALIDPMDIVVHGIQPSSRQLVYALSFFFFWGMLALTSVLSYWISPRKTEIKDYSQLA